MKKWNLSFIAAVALLAAVSCGKKTDDRTIVIHKTEKKAPVATKRVGDFSQTRAINWLGTSYNVTVSRKADTAQPQVADANGNKYYDNTISVRITRKDGSEFYNRTFTKSTFAPYMDKDFLKTSVLYSIVPVEATSAGLVLAASVGSPNQMVSDEYVPFTLTVSRQGALTISKDQKLDSSNADDGSEDVVDDGEAEE